MNNKHRLDATETFSIRVTRARKETLRRAACASGLSVNRWVQGAIDAALSEKAELAAFVAEKPGQL